LIAARNRTQRNRSSLASSTAVRRQSASGGPPSRRPSLPPWHGTVVSAALARRSAGGVGQRGGGGGPPHPPMSALASLLGLLASCSQAVPARCSSGLCPAPRRHPCLPPSFGRILPPLSRSPACGSTRRIPASAGGFGGLHAAALLVLPVRRPLPQSAFGLSRLTGTVPDNRGRAFDAEYLAFSPP
jgi:hypothetical protein